MRQVIRAVRESLGTLKTGRSSVQLTHELLWSGDGMCVAAYEQFYATISWCTHQSHSDKEKMESETAVRTYLRQAGGDVSRVPAIGSAMPRHCATYNRETKIQDMIIQCQ